MDGDPPSSSAASTSSKAQAAAAAAAAAAFLIEDDEEDEDEEVSAFELEALVKANRAALEEEEVQFTLTKFVHIQYKS